LCHTARVMPSLRTNIGLLIAIVFVATGAAVVSWFAVDYFYKSSSEYSAFSQENMMNLYKKHQIEERNTQVWKTFPVNSSDCSSHGLSRNCVGMELIRVDPDRLVTIAWLYMETSSTCFKKAVKDYSPPIEAPIECSDNDVIWSGLPPPSAP
jgi:hypothetical protein